MALTRVSGDLIGQNTVTNQNIAASVQDAYGWRNRIINGDMRIAQRGTSAVTTNGSWPVDRFQAGNNTDGAFTAQQDASAPAGFVNSVKFTTTTADATLTGTQSIQFQQKIEGTNFADLGWGTSSAQTVTLSFWVRSSLTGTFGGAVANDATDRSYAFAYSISAADTWEYKNVTIPGDTTGTWLKDTGAGMRLYFGLGQGPDRQGTAGVWTGSLLQSVTGAVSVIGTLNATWYITGVQLEAGSVATAFERRDYGRELAMCQRYFEMMDFTDVANGAIGNSTRWAATNDQWCSLQYKVLKRTAPSATSVGTVILYGSGSTATATPTLQYVGANSLCLRIQPASYTVEFGYVGNNSGFKLSVSAEL